MKRYLVVMAVVAFASQVQAQPAADPAASGGAPTAQAGAGPGGLKELRATCRTEARGQGLSGDALHAAVSACVVRARPDLAVRERCRTEGRAQGLHKEGLHSFVKDCVKAKA